ncbi:MAG: hypothetical protein HS116_16475 [Planctomycetes bacterium]|nr:hypothetical protein [Planctomycetota bacterium]
MAIRARVKWATIGAVVLLGALLAAFSDWTGLESEVLADPQGIKYTGAGACSAAACHGSATPKEGGATRHNENHVWSNNDKHAKAYTSLSNDVSKDLAKKLNIPDPTKSEKCIDCHALSGLHLANGSKRIVLKPEDIQAKGYSIEDGVSCDSCHGPADKYLKAHTEKGWTDKLRKELGAQKLYDEWGLYDTKNMKFRANQCISCHLQISSELIQAGHPELPFELHVFSSDEAWIHWRDKTPWSGTKAWAMGQTVALRESAYQLAGRLEQKAREDLVVDSYYQLAAHALMTRHVAALVDKAKLDELDKHLKAAHDGWTDPAKAAGALKEMAKTAEALADAVDKFTFSEEVTTKWRSGIAAEGEACGNVGFRAAEQLVLSLTSLSMVLDKEGKGDADARQATMDKLYEVLATREDFDKKKFIPVAKTLVDTFKGGTAIPLPPGGPGGGAASAPAVAEAKTPEPPPAAKTEEPKVEAKTEAPAAAPEAKTEAPKVEAKTEAPAATPPKVESTPPPAQEDPSKRAPLTKEEWGKFVFCPECGVKWPKDYKYCVRCGHGLPDIEKIMKEAGK